MDIFGFSISRKKATLNSQNNNDNLGLNFAYFNDSLNRDSIMQNSTIYACVRLLSETVSNTSLKMYKKLSNGKRERVETHDILNVVNNPNAFFDKTEFISQIVEGMTIDGVIFCEKIKVGGKLVGLMPLDEKSVNIKTLNPLVFEVKKQDETITTKDLLIIKNFGGLGKIKGYGILDTHKKYLQQLQQSEEFVKNNLTDIPNGYLTHPTLLTPQQREALGNNFGNKFMDRVNGKGYPVLEGGQKFERINLTPEQAQLEQVRQRAVIDIAKIFGVPPPFLMEDVQTSYNTVEQLNLSFINFTIKPILKRVETALNTLLDMSEKNTYFFEFDTKTINMTDWKTRSEVYKNLISGSINTVNEIREKENLPPVNGGDKLLTQMNMTDIKNL